MVITRIFVFAQISGTLWNTGQSLVMRVDGDTKHHVNITGGPLAYRYQFEEIYIHYGAENHQGSEHRIHGHAFPAEVRAKLITPIADSTHDRVWSPLAAHPFHSGGQFERCMGIIEIERG